MWLKKILKIENFFIRNYFFVKIYVIFIFLILWFFRDLKIIIFYVFK